MLVRDSLFLRLAALASLSASTFLFTGCAGGGGGSSSTGGGGGTSTPATLSISGVSPTDVPVGSSDITLVVTGTGFTSSSVVSLAGTAEPTTYVSDTQLKAAVAAAQLKLGTVLSVAVSNGSTTVKADAQSVALSVDNPVPALASVSPTAISLGAPDTVVTVTGSNFVPGVALAVNGTTRTTTFVSDTQLTAQLLASDFSSALSLPLNVINPKPGGGTSGTSAMAVNNPLPTISGVSPSHIIAGSGDTTVTVTGSGILSSTTLLLNGAAHAGTVVSGTQMTFVLTAAELANANTLAISLSNPQPGGGTSVAGTLSVDGTTPKITSLSPNTLPVGSPATTITINGTGFLSSATVSYAGVAHAATVINSTQITLPLTTTDLAYACTCAVVVTNPSGNGGASNVSTFTVQAKTPVISYVTPNSIIAGTGPTSIQVVGTNITSTSKVLWNGTPLATTYTYQYVFNGTTYVYQYNLIANVTADLIASTGTANITVTTPTAAAASNTLTVSITDPPVPTITSLSPNYAPINADAAITVYGSGFTKNSVVSYNGTALTTTFSNTGTVSVKIPANVIPTPGNGAITVTTPAPGGGTSTGVNFTTYLPVVSNNMVYNPVNGLAYLSIPSTGSTLSGNSVVSMDPATGTFGTAIFVGSEPGVMAVSDDGKTLWVALNGTNAIRKVDLVNGVAGAQYSVSALGTSTSYNVSAMLVLPGTTDSVAVTNSNALGIFDAGVLRGSIVYVNSAYALQADGTRSELYAGGYSLQAYTYSNSGLTLKSSGNYNYNYLASSGYDEMQLSSGVMYTDIGRVFDPESSALLGTFTQGTTTISGPTLYDAGLSQIYVLNNGTSCCSGYSQVSLFSPTDYSNTGKSFQWNIPSYLYPTAGSTIYLSAHRLTRWGANGLLLHTKAAIFTAQSNVIKDQSSVNADVAVTLASSGGTTTGSTATYTATIKNNGPNPATDVALILTAPSTGILTSTTSTTGTCTTLNGCTFGTLASGATATVTVQALQTTAGTGALTALVQTSANDATSSNNSATASVTVTGSTYNLVPTLVSISPNAVKAGSADTTITVTGTNFASGSTVKLGSNNLTTTYVSSTQLTATVPAASLTSMGWSNVSVSTPTPGGGTSGSLPLSFYNVVAVGLNHLVYEPFTRQLYASVSGGSSSVTGSSIVRINPATGTFGTPVTFNTAPNVMALSSSGQTLYTGLTTPSSNNALTSSIGRLDLTNGTSDTINLPGVSYGNSVYGLAIQPGTENTVVFGYGYAQSTLYDFNTTTKTFVMRGTGYASYSSSCNYFLNANNLVSSYYYNLAVYPVSVSGLGSGTTISSNLTSCFQLAGSTAATLSGQVFNLTTSSVIQKGAFSLPSSYNNSNSALPALALDTSLQQAFYPANTSSVSYGYVDGIQSYDLNSFLRTGSIFLNIPTIEGGSYSTSFNDLVRWGQDGLALVTSTGHLYLLRGPFVVPQELGTNSAATLTSSSTTTITAGTGNTLLTLTGSNFIPGVAVTWNGSYRTTTIVDATHVTVAIPASDLAAAGTGALVATNPGASASSAITITVQ